jgi:hypothetical protein
LALSWLDQEASRLVDAAQMLSAAHSSALNEPRASLDFRRLRPRAALGLHEPQQPLNLDADVRHPIVWRSSSQYWPSLA